MARVIEVHPLDPQPRRVAEIAAAVRDGAVIVYPTDSSYAIGCGLGDKDAVARIRRVRGLDHKHLFTLVCRDLSEIATYARVDNRAYRLLRSMTPGPYTFILPATKQVPKRLQHPRRRTVGIRVTETPIARAIVDILREPMLSTTMALPGQDEPLTDPLEIADVVGAEVDIVVDGGPGGDEPTSVIDLVGDVPEVLRRGMGDVSRLLRA